MRRLAYVAMLAGSIGVFFAVQSIGSHLETAGHGAAPSIAATPTNRLVHVLVALLVVIVLARLVGMAFRKIGQPPVIGEIVAGIMLGPSLLGRIAPDASAWLLPADVAPFLRVIAEVGVIIYMFLVGVHLNVDDLRRRTRVSIAVSHASIVLPFVLGTLLALWLYPHWAPTGIKFGSFALFIGVAMSITAFPVLARILTDRNLQSTQLGGIALACAAVDDVTAWCLLALLVGAVRAEPGNALITIAFACAFMTAILVFAPRVIGRLSRRVEERDTLDQGTLAILCIGVLLCALTTEVIGIHALFGAFLLGAVIPHDSKLATHLRARLEDVVLVLMLPAFFAFTGMRTQINALGSAYEWLACAVIIAVAAFGKLGGSTIAARLTGLSWRNSLALGVLMNTRGLMELIVLNIGMDLGIVSPPLFTMFVVMALVTAIATSPLVTRLVPALDAVPQGDVPAAPGKGRGGPRGWSPWPPCTDGSSSAERSGRPSRALAASHRI